MIIPRVKEFFRPARAWIKPLLRPAAPLVQAVIRHSSNARMRRLIWELIGVSVCAEPRRFTTRTVHGITLRGNTRDYIDRYLYYFGVWEPNLSLWIARRLVRGDMFVDVGANIGYYALLAARAVGSDGHVVAIEASPKIFDELRHNLSLNNVDNIRCVNVAVSDSETDLPLYDGPMWHTSTTSVICQQGLSLVGSVRAKRLTEILSEQEYTSARLFKIDVEGAEWLVVSGIAESLWRTRPDAEFIIEVSPARLALQGRTPDDIIAAFRAAGFNGYRIANSYSAGSYLDREAYQAPKRLREQITEDTDMIFSRCDMASL